MTFEEKAQTLQRLIPQGGLFQDKNWRISPDVLSLDSNLYDSIAALGPRLLAFNKACNLLYRQSVANKQPQWISEYLDRGKPPELIQSARHNAIKNEIPFVIRPDLLLTEDGFMITELDSVPGGIGLTAWLQEAYSQWLPDQTFETHSMLRGFLNGLMQVCRKQENVLPEIAIVISDESSDYLPEMKWIVNHPETRTILGDHIHVCHPSELKRTSEGVWLQDRRLDGVYRFFELFDLPQIPHGHELIREVENQNLKMTPPCKPQLEEKLLFALFWFPQLAGFWRRELGDRYFQDLRSVIPFTWLMDPTPLPPHAALPRLDIQHWEGLTEFSQKKRELILKISGFSEKAWGSRGVVVGSDVPQNDWKASVLQALRDFDHHPHILQPFVRTRLIEHAWFDFGHNERISMKARARLCPYFFVQGEKVALHGILATLCPSDKKIIHGMADSILTLAIPQT